MLRQAGTERPYVGEYTDAKTVGVYACRACGAELFTSETKFDSHCGWPSFFSPLAGESVEYIEDRSLPGRPRVEVRCATCGSHLGHVFEGEGYDTPTDQRYCINSISLTLRPADSRRPPDRRRYQGRQAGSRPMKPSIRSCTGASSGTATRGPYWPDDRSSSSMGSMPASSSAQRSGSSVSSWPVARARSHVCMKTSTV